MTDLSVCTENWEEMTREEKKNLHEGTAFISEATKNLQLKLQPRTRKLGPACCYFPLCKFNIDRLTVR